VKNGFFKKRMKNQGKKSCEIYKIQISHENPTKKIMQKTKTVIFT